MFVFVCVCVRLCLVLQASERLVSFLKKIGALWTLRCSASCDAVLAAVVVVVVVVALVAEALPACMHCDLCLYRS